MTHNPARVNHEAPRDPVTVDLVRQSPPGTTWWRDHPEGGGVYEWTGKKLWWHFVPHDDSGDYIDDVDPGGGWSRSDALPKLDYSRGDHHPD